MKKKYQFVWLVQKYSFFLLVILMFSTIGSLASASQQSAWTWNLNAFLGSKTLDEDDWTPVEEQIEFGIEFDFRRGNWPISIVIEYFNAADDANLWSMEIESKTSELNVGVRKTWNHFQYIHPFIDGGVSFINGEFKALGMSDDDSSGGAWIGGGIYWTLDEHLNIGLEVKGSSADVNLFGVDVDAGGGHYGLLVGYHW